MVDNFSAPLRNNLVAVDDAVRYFTDPLLFPSCISPVSLPIEIGYPSSLLRYNAPANADDAFVF